MGLSLCSLHPWGSSHATLGIMSGFPDLTAYPLGWLTHLTKVLPKQDSPVVSHRVSVFRDPCRLPGQSETASVFLCANRLPRGCLNAPLSIKESGPWNCKPLFRGRFLPPLKACPELVEGGGLPRLLLPESSNREKAYHLSASCPPLCQRGVRGDFQSSTAHGGQGNPPQSPFSQGGSRP